MRASSGAWNQKGRSGRFPIWVVFSNKGLGLDLHFWQQNSIPRWIVSKNPLNFDSAKTGVTNLCYGEENPAKFVAEKLAQAGVETTLLFGGGEINYLFYEAGLVNELKLTVCPLVVARLDAPDLISPKLSRPIAFRLMASKAISNHVFLEYSVH
jgi:5-amino-6-(5-phosphoribosylamino)uracil reductase